MPRRWNKNHVLPSQRLTQRPQQLQRAKKPQQQNEGNAKRLKLEHKPLRTADAPRSREDEDILYYARKLKVKNGKLPKSAEDDGLDDLTEGLDLQFLDDLLGIKTTKKKAPQRIESSDEDEGESDSSIPDDNEDQEGGRSDDNDDEDDDSDEDDEITEQSDDKTEIASTKEVAPPKRERENPYLPPSTPATSAAPATGGRYVPPSLRHKLSQDNSDSEDAIRLRRQCQGLLNRLSEANIASIVAEYQQMYLSNSRQNMTSTVTQLIIESTAQRAVLLDSFVIVHGALVASLYKHVGIDFGAHFVQTLVENFDKYYSSGSRGKECSNLMVLLSQLYTFQAVGCGLVYDFIRLFIQQVNELNTELLLKLIQNAGGQLRHDDPAALKDIITSLQKAVQAVPASSLTPRTKFLIETVTSWKNNRLKQTSAISLESISRMRKYLGNIAKTAEPLRASLDDIRNVETNGKWWLVGAAWSGSHAALHADGAQDADVDVVAVKDILDTAAPDWLALARTQRMNTDVRRAVFVAIMGAEDYVDANERLMRLKLKRTQEREIPYVLLHCCAGEKEFNPFYAYLAAVLCKQRSMAKTFQFALWDFFKTLDSSLGEDDEESDDDKEDVDDVRFLGREESDSTRRRKVKNYARFYAILLGEGRLGLDVLKNVNFLTCTEDLLEFMRYLFKAMFNHIRVRSARQKDRLAGEKALIQLIIKIKDNETLLKGIEFLLKVRLAAETKKERMKWGANILCDSIDRLNSV
ncbi:uncharacterized protein V1518DRAFT_385909 [Limtongia smithiae]|uniref:uncharacterized protein n=1 Tax=Limtongia smithiae TaxID=1125753 RepID=UPI0034CEC69E